MRSGELPASGSSADEIWLSATWPFVRDQLPKPPARIVELGCGESGGHLAALLDVGYDALGVDPEAPERPGYRRIAFEDYVPDAPLDGVIASLSLHHVADPGIVLDHVCDVLAPGGTLVVIEWISEFLDEATAQWCFHHQVRNPTQPGAWLAELRSEWIESAVSWDVFFGGWLERHGLHSASTIRRALDARFVTAHDSTGPYYFPDLLDADATVEQAAIDAGAIKAGCLRYAGLRAPRLQHRPASSGWAVMPRTWTCRVATSMTNSTYGRRRKIVSTWKKSQASNPCA